MITRIVVAFGGVALVVVAFVLHGRGQIRQAVAAGSLGGVFILWAIRRPNQLPAGGESARGVAPSNHRPGDNPNRKEPR